MEIDEMTIRKKRKKNLGLKVNLTLTFAMTGCNALSIKQIKPTREQAIVMPEFFSGSFNHLGCLFNYKDHKSITHLSAITSLKK